MIRHHIRRRREQEGVVLVIAIVMLAVGSASLGYILTATMTYARNGERAYCHDRAAFLADSGIQAAVVKLNAAGEGNISFNESRGLFARTNAFEAPDWGFETAISVVNGHDTLKSTGRFRGHRVEAQCEVALGAGSRSIHALYAHALFAGNSSFTTNYVLKVGGTGSGADFVCGDTYSGGHIQLSGSSRLRLPELLYDLNSDGICGPSDTWVNAYATQVFTNPLTQAQFDAYESSMEPYADKVYANGRKDPTEAYVDTIGNGVYDLGEPFDDENGNGVWNPGDAFTDLNGNGRRDAGEPFEDLGNGVYDDGEEWDDDDDPAHHNKRLNNKYDGPGGFWRWNSNEQEWRWRTQYTKNDKTYYCASWPGEEFEDDGDGVYDPGEDYTDQNGVYDPGEEYYDDRNSIYDYGTQATGDITGMPAPGPGQRAATGHDARLDPPSLTRMYYSVNRNDPEPDDALTRWGNDYAVTASDYGSAPLIADSSRPEHIFIRNPPTSDYVDSGEKRVYGREYVAINDSSGSRVDDYFLEDPTDSSYNNYISGDSIDGTVYTAPMYLNVRSEHNVKLYYVDGNLYIHNPKVYSMRFRQPDTRITIVAKGNITISDEFFYKADYDPDLERSDMNSTIVRSPTDALCLIALKNPNCSNSGNIYIGDRQFGTGGSIHAMLYAENDFVDNNINTKDQQFISVFGNMTAGNQVQLNRVTGSGHYRTRLDVTLDERIRDGEIIVPGLPHPVGVQRGIMLDTAWHMVPGTWACWSALQ